MRKKTADTIRRSVIHSYLTAAEKSAAESLASHFELSVSDLVRKLLAEAGEKVAEQV